MNALHVRHGVTARDDTSAAAARLIDTYARTPSEDPRRSGIRADAILAWTPMANRLARMYSADYNIREDLRQTAAVGLIKAVDGFDPVRGDDFVAYAVPTIRGELKRYLRDHSGPLRAPRRLHDLHMRIEDASRHISQPLARLPTPTDMPLTWKSPSSTSWRRCNALTPAEWPRCRSPPRSRPTSIWQRRSVRKILDTGRSTNTSTSATPSSTSTSGNSESWRSTTTAT